MYLLSVCKPYLINLRFDQLTTECQSTKDDFLEEREVFVSQLQEQQPGQGFDALMMDQCRHDASPFECQGHYYTMVHKYILIYL